MLHVFVLFFAIMPCLFVSISDGCLLPNLDVSFKSVMCFCSRAKIWRQ